MYIANLTYVKPLAEVEEYLEEHIAFLEKYYELGKFICSGRKNPRDGGIILFNATDETEMNQIISEDPFHVNKIANYEIIEFYPTKYSPDFKCFID
ncbi:YciI family protein [Paenibacillus sp. BAC0078]